MWFNGGFSHKLIFLIYILQMKKKKSIFQTVLSVSESIRLKPELVIIYGGFEYLIVHAEKKELVSS